MLLHSACRVIYSFNPRLRVLAVRKVGGEELVDVHNLSWVCSCGVFASWEMWTMRVVSDDNS